MEKTCLMERLIQVGANRERFGKFAQQVETTMGSS